MKSVTEFANYTLIKGLNAKTALAAEGKTPEEIQANLGETFKYEGDKLKHFMAALEVAAPNLENLSRVLVVSVAEGETAPPKATKVEEHHYYPEFTKAAKPPLMQRTDPKGGPRKGGPGKGAPGPKESPWGMSPEQKAAKKAGNKAANKPS
jgi:hypothetical protein